MGAEARLKKLGITIPRPEGRLKIARAVRVGNLVFSSGNVSPEKGKIGKDLTLEQGYEAACKSALATLGNLYEVLESLDQVVRVVKMTGFVNCGEGFSDTPNVMHGATDLLNDLFGAEAGFHARSAIGVYQLPGDAAVELELIVEISG